MSANFHFRKWEKLVNEGKARRIKEGGHTRYELTAKGWAEQDDDFFELKGDEKDERRKEKMKKTGTDLIIESLNRVLCRYDTATMHDSPLSHEEAQMVIKGCSSQLELLIEIIKGMDMSDRQYENIKTILKDFDCFYVNGQSLGDIAEEL